MINRLVSIFTGKPANTARFTAKRWAMATETRTTRNERNLWVAYSDRT